MKVYSITATSYVDATTQIHSKAYDDWNRAVRYLVETYGVHPIDITPLVDLDGKKTWSVRHPDHDRRDIMFTIHQLDLS